jgi:Divergent InlB B-repeat domain/HYDIN/CFA65/VesB-like, Ig-like domain
VRLEPITMLRATCGLALALFAAACNAPFRPSDPDALIRVDGSIDPDAAPSDAMPDGGNAQLVLDLGHHAFGDVVIGQRSTAARFTVSNHGEPMQTALATMLVGDATDFAIATDQCNGRQLAAGDSCAIEVWFAPAMPGDVTSTLRVDGGAAGAPTAALTGTGIAPGALQFDDPAHDFGALAVAAASAPVTFAFHNTGQSTTGVLAVTVSDAAFDITSDPCTGLALPTGHDCTVAVRFKPSAVGPASASIKVTADPGGTATLSLGGTGTATVTVQPSGGGTGTVKSTPAGITCGATCTAAFGTSAVTLKASADPESRFLGWTGGACSGVGDCTLSLAAAVTVGARFEHHQVLTMIVAGAGSGTVTPTPGTACTTGTCTGSYAYGDVVALTAQAGVGATFSGWSGACTKDPCIVTMDAARTVTATFTKDTHAVTVVRQGTGSGTIKSSPVGIDCGGTCKASFGYGQVVALTPQPSGGSTFTGWADCDTVSGQICTVTMTKDHTVTPTFTLGQSTLSVQVQGDGTGTVKSDMGEIDCPGGSCSATFDNNHIVTLSANPGTGADFEGWSDGPCGGTNPTCSVTMDAAKSVTATFARKTFTLTVANAGLGGSMGAYTKSSDGRIDCHSTCSATYKYNDAVTLTAYEDASHQFTNWSGCTPGMDNPCTVYVTGDMTVTARFIK